MFDVYSNRARFLTAATSLKGNARVQSASARLLRDSAVIVWDEAPMAHKVMLDAVDMLLQELMGSSRPFGGKIILLGGDWRQCPPVLRYVDRDAVSSLTIASLPFWKAHQYTHCRLTQNMRAREDLPYAEFCMTVGDGSLPRVETDDSSDLLSAATVSLPSAICAPPSFSAGDLLSWVYEGFAVTEPAQWSQFYESRAVLAPTNEAADDLNAHMYLRNNRSLLQCVNIAPMLAEV